MVFNVTKKDFFDLIEVAKIGAFESNNIGFELSFDKSIPPDDDFKKLNDFKKYLKLRDDLSEFQCEEVEKEADLNDTTCSHFIVYATKLTVSSQNCKNCGEANFELRIRNRPDLQHEILALPIFCKSCFLKEHMAQHEAYKKQRIKEFHPALEVLYGHYCDLENLLSKNKTSLKTKDRPLKILMLLMDISHLAPNAKNRSEEIEYVARKKLIDFNVLNFQKLSYETFCDTHYHSFEGTNIRATLLNIEKSINTKGVQYIPKLFYRTKSFNPDELNECFDWYENLDPIQDNRKYTDEDFISFAKDYAKIFHINLDDMKSTTMENIIKILAFRSELETFKVITSTIKGASNFSKEKQLGKAPLRNLTIKFLNEAYLKYNPNGDFKYDVSRPYEEWELEEEFGIVPKTRRLEELKSFMSSFKDRRAFMMHVLMMY